MAPTWNYGPRLAHTDPDHDQYDLVCEVHRFNAILCSRVEKRDRPWNWGRAR